MGSEFSYNDAYYNMKHVIDSLELKFLEALAEKQAEDALANPEGKKPDEAPRIEIPFSVTVRTLEEMYHYFQLASVAGDSQAMLWLLRFVISPLIQALHEQGAAEGWFDNYGY